MSDEMKVLFYVLATIACGALIAGVGFLASCSHALGRIARQMEATAKIKAENAKRAKELWADHPRRDVR